MKPETRRLKALLAELGIPRTGSGASCPRAGVVVAALLTDDARRIAAEHADRLVAEGFAVLLSTYRCGCPARVWLCSSSRPSLRRTVQNWRHDCPVDGELLPVTAIDWLASAKDLHAESARQIDTLAERLTHDAMRPDMALLKSANDIPWG